MAKVRLTVGLDARLFVSDPEPTGVGYYARELARHLAPLADLHLFTDRRAVLPTAPVGVSAERSEPPTALAAMVHLVRRWPGVPWQQTALVAELLRHRVSVYHSPTFTLPRLTPCPTVVTVHDLGALAHPEWANAANRRYLERMLPWAVHNATRVVTVSERVRSEVVDYFHLSAAEARRVVAVRLGVDHERFRPRPSHEVAAVRARYHLEDPYLLFLGTREPRKNLARLVTAFRVAQRQHPRYRLVLAGPPGFRTDALDDAVRATPRVHLLNWVPDVDVPLLLQGAAALCYVSLYEGFGLPVLEAMAVGTPVITSQDTVMQDISGGHARYVNPQDADSIADALLAVMADPAGSREAARPYVSYARALSWNRTARETLYVYREACRC